MKKLVFAVVAAFAMVSVGNVFAGSNNIASAQEPAPTDTVEAPAPQPSEPQPEPQQEPQQEPQPENPAPAPDSSLVINM